MNNHRYLKKKVIAMLKENTGSHFLDSGSAYGRNWERNQTRKFDKEEACQVEISENDDETVNEILISYNLYHYLVNFLDLNDKTKKLNIAFGKFGKLLEYKYKGWLEFMEEYAQSLENKGLIKSWNTFNSYNYDNILSQVIQGTWLIAKEHKEEYLMLQIHNGCDVRGGYTQPYIFHVPDPGYFHMAQFNVEAMCIGLKLNPKQDTLPLPDIQLSPYCENNWSSDDGGYHFYYDGCSSDEKPLMDYTKYDPETKKLVCTECGGEIVFSVMEGY